MGELMTFVIEHFWTIILVLALLSLKGHRMSGIALIAIYTVWGIIAWATLLIVAISIYCEFMRWYWRDPQVNKRRKEKPVKRETEPPLERNKRIRLVGERVDPDYN